MKAFYVVNSDTYFGKKNDEAKTITGVYVCQKSDTVPRAFNEIAARYIKAKALGNLSVIELGGVSDIPVRKMNRSEQLEFKIAKMYYQEAKETAISNLVNDTFDQIRKK